jgi:hypothetical protein
MTIWTPGQSAPTRKTTPQIQVPEPPPEPTEEERKAAGEVASYLKEKLTTHAARLALLSEPETQDILAEWMNVLMPAFAPQISQLDRQQLFISVQETLKDEKMRMDLQGIKIGLDPSTMQTCMNVLLHICQRLPPPFLQFQKNEEAPTGGSDNQSETVSQEAKGETPNVNG